MSRRDPGGEARAAVRVRLSRGELRALMEHAGTSERSRAVRVGLGLAVTGTGKPLEGNLPTWWDQVDPSGGERLRVSVMLTPSELAGFKWWAATEDKTRAVRMKLGLPVRPWPAEKPPRRKHGWTTKEEDQVWNLWFRGARDKAISEATGRKARTVRALRHRRGWHNPSGRPGGARGDLSVGVTLDRGEARALLERAGTCEYSRALRVGLGLSVVGTGKPLEENLPTWWEDTGSRGFVVRVTREELDQLLKAAGVTNKSRAVRVGLGLPASPRAGRSLVEVMGLDGG